MLYQCLRGGALLRLFRFLVIAAMAVTFSAAAWADGIPGDPKITIKQGGGSPTTNHGTSQADPIIVADGSGEQNFLLGTSYNSTDTLLFVEVVPAVGESAATFNSEFFTCDPGIAQQCFFTSPITIPGIEVAFYAPAGLFVPGLDLQVSVPEPSILTLFVVGLFGVMLLGYKKAQLVRA
jgi:hypothetical protein